MASSRDAALIALSTLAAACSVGVGEGSACGVVNEPACELAATEYCLDPSFYGADLAPDGMLEIRVQRGGDLEGKSDGLILLVRDLDDVVRPLLGQAIPLGDAASPVMMSFYLNDTCKIDRGSTPVTLLAKSGTITFSSIYSETSDEDDVEIAASFESVHFTDDARPDERNATLSGNFKFLYNRGRPAQRFP